MRRIFLSIFLLAFCNFDESKFFSYNTMTANAAETVLEHQDWSFNGIFGVFDLVTQTGNWGKHQIRINAYF